MLSLYTHIPFCVKKCHYCGFYSTPYDVQSADRLISALQLEAAGHAGSYVNRVFDTIFIGGGTPSMLSPEQFRRMAASIKEQFRIAENVEFTVEANPQSGSDLVFTTLLACGVNRLNIGVQACQERLLQTLGRPHSAVLALQAVASARRSGFTNVGLDLIYGIPGQTASDWLETLEIVLALKPQHISSYSLSLDEGSRYCHDAAAGVFHLPEDDMVARLYDLGVQKLTAAGYVQYEISNFSLQGFECRHNMNYWNRGEYLGLGPGASSFIANRRSQTKGDWKDHCTRLESGIPPDTTEEEIGSAAAVLETVMLGLRMSTGIELARFADMFGEAALSRLLSRASPMIKADVLRLEAGRLSLTSRGMILSNEALARLA